MAQLVKNPSACKARDPGAIPGLGRSSGEGNGCPLQCPGEFHGLCIVLGVAKSQVRKLRRREVMADSKQGVEPETQAQVVLMQSVLSASSGGRC